MPNRQMSKVCVLKGIDPYSFNMRALCIMIYTMYNACMRKTLRKYDIRINKTVFLLEVFIERVISSLLWNHS